MKNDYKCFIMSNCRILKINGLDTDAPLSGVLDLQEKCYVIRVLIKFSYILILVVVSFAARALVFHLKDAHFKELFIHFVGGV